MNLEAAVNWVDTLIVAKTGEHLNPLQRQILESVWLGRKYSDIAGELGYTEGHIKDVGSLLWKLLSESSGQKITKVNYRAVIERHLPPERSLTPSLPPPETVNFLGRSGAIADLNRLVTQGCKVIVIQGEGGVGKTTLAQQFLSSQGFELILELLMAQETQNIASPQQVIEEWLKQDLQLEPGTEFPVTLGRLKRQLQSRRIGILIDNLEPALDGQGRIIADYRNYVELLRILADSRVQTVTLVTSRDRLCEPGLNIEHYRLPGLSQEAWERYFAARSVAVDPAVLQSMHRAYGGNAKAMGILRGAAIEDFAGDLTAYWQEHQADLLAAADLKNLVASQFNRLQSLDPAAYQLLCRLGCYRYQDLPTVPTSAVLSLLWNFPPSQCRAVMTGLRNRSLLECQHGGYWLHPVIRAEAIARLRASTDWQIANHKAAEFWSTSVQTLDSTQEALQALEAFYHYVEINEVGLAGKVLLKSRHNQWQQFLPLGSALYRMGLLQPAFTAIAQVMSHSSSAHSAVADQTLMLPSNDDLSELSNILGDLHWISGEIHAAIACQEKTIFLSRQALESLTPEVTDRHRLYYLKMLQVDSLLSIGLYNIDLWELAIAAEQFRQVITLTDQTPHHRWAEKAKVCLALVLSYLGQVSEATTLAAITYENVIEQQVSQTGRFAYFIQLLGQTYTNLGDFAKAEALYQKALTFAQASHYPQIKAKTLSGLAEVYRHQAAFEAALAHHHQAIALLDNLGAKCDLAIAQFQMGLTHQQLNNPNDSQACFQLALQLFTQIQAPKQLQRILAYSPS
jgi:tetratricopeptide (TPR) repeat protein